MLLKCFSCLIIIHFLHQTSYGKRNNPYCGPSACGHIHNISYPFRLIDDPKHCGDHKYELACDDNTPSIYLNSQKYFVQAINYHNYTIHLTYPAIKVNDTCSFPDYSLSAYNFTKGYPYSTKSHIRDEQDMVPNIARSITFMSCASYVVNNNSLVLETTGADCFNELNRRRRTYVKFGELNGSYVMDMCSIELSVMTSLPIKGDRRVSLSEIHSSLLYGFELSWFGVRCRGKCGDCWLNGTRATCYGYAYYCTLWVESLCDSSLPHWFTIDRIITTLATVGGYGSALNLALRILIGMPCMLGLLIYKLRRRHLSMFDVIEGFLRSNNSLVPIRYSYSNIKQLTRGFREKLGEGGYGSVFKGKLRSGLDVAVKILSKPNANGQDFINEVATIGRIHHVNVVNLIGYCAERSKRALIYEFMPKGSLEKYICGQGKTNSLSWQRKYEIAIGVARGIEYLHRGCDIQILHFDIKPHNILLDDNFIPKISDFGLAKICSTETATVTLTAARGTIGYVAPELINRSIGRVSYKADVYSFGMLLMEMIGLNRDIVANDDESSKYFPQWIYDCFNKGKDIEIGNAYDIDEYDDDEHMRKKRRKMAIVGLWCIQISPDARPSMSEVVKMLEGENEVLSIPPEPSQSPQVIHNNVQTWETTSDSIALLLDDASCGE